MAGLTLILLPERFAVCRLAPDAPIPPLPLRASLVAMTLTAEELSLVLPETATPEGVKVEGGWRALRVAGVLDFSLTGVLASLAAPLAQAGVSIFAVSTYDTDYLLVRESDLEHTIGTLVGVGYEVRRGA